MKRKRNVVNDEDDFDVDDLFEETDEGDVVVDVDTEGESEGEAVAVESDEDGLFVAKKETRAAPRATTRQLAMMVQKNMKELYKLAKTNLSKPESLCVDQNTLRQVVDTVKIGEAADLSSGKLVHFGKFLINPEMKSMRSTQEPKGLNCPEFSAVKAGQKLSLPSNLRLHSANSRQKRSSLSTKPLIILRRASWQRVLDYCKQRKYPSRLGKSLFLISPIVIGCCDVSCFQRVFSRF